MFYIFLLINKCFFFERNKQNCKAMGDLTWRKARSNPCNWSRYRHINHI